MAVDTVAQPGRRRAIGKYMAEMAAAIGAADLRADHAELVVAVFRHDARLHRLEIARPAASGVELGVGDKQRLVAGGAAVQAFFGTFPIGAGGGTQIGRASVRERGCQYGWIS